MHMQVGEITELGCDVLKGYLPISHPHQIPLVCSGFISRGLTGNICGIGKSHDVHGWLRVEFISLSQLVLPFSVGACIEAFHQLEVNCRKSGMGDVSFAVIGVNCLLGVIVDCHVIEDALAQVVLPH